MSDQQGHNFITIDLDAKLLSADPKIQTNWHVITGAPCCGKTTLIDQLTAAGFKTVPEPGRLFIEQELAKGRTIEEIRSDVPEFQRLLFRFYVDLMQGLDPQDVLFHDRGFPEFITFGRANGVDPHGFMPDCIKYRFASLFVLDRFPVQLDGVRTEDDATAAFLDEWLERDYRTLGYDVVRVPVMSREERLRFILDYLHLA